MVVAEGGHALRPAERIRYRHLSTPAGRRMLQVQEEAFLLSRVRSEAPHIDSSPVIQQGQMNQEKEKRVGSVYWRSRHAMR